MDYNTKLKKVKDTLPDKLSELIYVALADMEMIEMMSDKYKIEMDTWHGATSLIDIVDRDGLCAVCFAGGVMANSLGIDSRESCSPHIFTDNISAKLRALDCIRTGHVLGAFNWMNIDWDDEIMETRLGLVMHEDVADYDAYGDEINGEEFKADMLAIADMLAGAGY